MNPKQFLQVGGAVLLVVGILGYLGLIGPTADQSIFGNFWWFDNGENFAHTFLGVVALAAVYLPGLNTVLTPYYKAVVILVGVLALFFGLYGFLVSASNVPNTFGLANLENPADNILHLVVGAWALWAAFSGMVQGKHVETPTTK